MSVTERQRRDLAAALAAKLPQWDRREAVARAAGISDPQIAGSPETAWTVLVADADASGRLPDLLDAAARALPDDAVVAELAKNAREGRFDVPPPPRLPVAVVAGGVGVLALAMVAVAVYAMSSGPSAPVEPTPVARVEAPPAPPASMPSAPAPAPAPAPDVAPAPVTEVLPTAPPPVASAPAPAPAAVAAPEPTAAVTASTSSRSTSSPPTSSGPCANAEPIDGAVVGYAYAGDLRPKITDHRWTPDRSANVRLRYPTRDNHFDAKAHVVCTVPRGVTVDVDDPIAVPGGAWWVPVKR